MRLFKFFAPLVIEQFKCQIVIISFYNSFESFSLLDTLDFSKTFLLSKVHLRILKLY